MKWILSLCIGLVFAAENNFPSYETEINASLALSHQGNLAPEYLRFKFNEVKNKKRDEVRDYLYEKRDALYERQKSEKQNFEDKAKKDRADWKLKNPKGNPSDLNQKITQERQALSARHTQEKKQQEDELKDLKKQFDEFLKIKEEEFRKKHATYVQSQRENAKKMLEQEEHPVMKEFREIPKGPGIPLKPQ